MGHGDLEDVLGGRFAKCECSHCLNTKAFQEFRDLADPPPRPVKIDTRLEAAAFLKWYAAQLLRWIDWVEKIMEKEA